ncbi:MAG TPA: DUF3137 domain-containing protein [Myxococcota bacterium]|nr:DUF3137 domain-containing protein [Myxococcota bacterium]
MRSREEFDAFLREQIAPKLRGLESQRRAAVRAARVDWRWKGALAAAGVAGWIATQQLWTAVVLAALPWLIEAYRKLRAAHEMAPIIRGEVLKPAIEFWDPSFRYRSDEGIPQSVFEASRLFAGESFNRYSGEDLVSGRHGATEFRFSELRVAHVTRSNKRSHTRTVFRGLFFIADFNKSFRGQTLVLPDHAERSLGTLGRAFQSLASAFSNLTLVELENPEFERHFVVHSSDPTEARYVLSPSLMERILSFHRKTGAKLRLAFLAGRVCVAIPTETDRFRVDALAPLTLDDVRRWAGDLLFAISLIDELDLNTRIWSKAAPAA